MVADHVPDYLFAPTELTRKNLVNKGIPENNITSSGNTIVDALNENLRFAEGRSDILAQRGLARKDQREGSYESRSVREKSEGTHFSHGTGVACIDYKVMCGQ